MGAETVSVPNAQLVKQLRERTGAGVLDCQAALRETNGDLEKAILYLREKGISSAAKKAGRAASDGVIGTYIHPGAKLGVLIEVNCETDFVARTDDFQQLVKSLAMQVAAASPPPEYVRREEIPADRLEQEAAIFRAQVKDKPSQLVEQIVKGKLDKFCASICLMDQPFIRDSAVTVGDMVTQAIAKLGENITVRRFTRYQLGASG
ncbi:MAG TPA: translation elongation factor Ts [Nitrospiria bacterium]|nr:translation elongation factor Ts [Nitrospiria bacterium]